MLPLTFPTKKVHVTCKCQIFFVHLHDERANKTKNERLSTDIRRAVCLSLATGERDGGCCERIENKKVKHKKATILCKAILRTTTPPSFILVKNP